MLNNKGPSIEPSGTPAIIYRSLLQNAISLQASMFLSFDSVSSGSLQIIENNSIIQQPTGIPSNSF